MKKIFDFISYECSKKVTKTYKIATYLLLAVTTARLLARFTGIFLINCIG